MSEKISTILLDMDEVLTDFVGGACRLHGVSREEVDELRAQMGTWYVEPVLTLLLNRRIQAEDFWKPIHEQGEGFWTGLELLPWAHELIEYVKSLQIDWHIVTSPSRCPSSYSGKVKYLKRMFGSHFDRFVISPHKHLLAKPGVVLIDDREENIEKFIKAGGDGLVFPSAGNKFHKLSQDPVAHIRSMFNSLETSYASDLQ